jgi:hypothetical protein
MRTHVCKSKRLRTAVSWTSLPQGLVEHVLTLLPLRVVATAARTCQAWVPAARVVRLRAQLKEALLEPEELIWRRYSGGAERMGREGYDRFLVEVCGCKEEETMTDEEWASIVTVCSMDRGGFLHGEYGVCGRDAAADADLLTDQAMLQALLAEAAACPSVRKLSEALEARLAEADLMRPMWTVTTPRLLEILAAQQNDVETVQRCCRQLGQLDVGTANWKLERETDSNQDVVGELGGAEIVVASLQAHPYVEAVQGAGCYALANLVESHPANTAAAVAAGGIEAVVAALRAHPGAEVAQVHGCDALSGLMVHHPANQTAAAAAGAVEALVAALQAHPGSQSVQRSGCHALASLVGCHLANQTAAVAAAGIEAVVAAMRAHPGSESVLEGGCDALSELVTNGHHANQTAAAAAGAVEALVAALQAHPGSQMVQRSGCEALAYLVCYHPTATAAHPANQTAVAAAGGIEAVVAALRAHPGSEEVQEMGCYALRWLVHGHPVNTATAVAAGAIGLAEATRGRFEAGALVPAHEEGVHLLGSLGRY